MTTRSSKWPGLILILIILFSFFAGIAESQDFTLPPNGELLVLPRGESLLLPVFKPKRVAVTDPTIADVVMVSTEQVLINGISVGTTSLQIWETNGVVYYRVRVVPNPDALVAELRKQLALPEVNIYMFGDKVILDGMIERNTQRERALKLASAYGEVVDLLEVEGASGEPDLAKKVANIIDRPDITVRAINDYLVLEGEVPTLEERQRAELLASTYERPILNFLEISSRETPIEVLAKEIAEHIAIPSIQVKVIAGETFLLEGSVSDPALRDRASAIAHAFGRPVVNLIQVEETPPSVASAAEEKRDQDEKSSAPRSGAGTLDEKQEPQIDPQSTLEPKEIVNSTLETTVSSEASKEKDIKALAEAMRQEIDDPNVSLRVIQDAILLEGVVQSEHVRERISAIVGLYPVRTVNLLQVKDTPDRDLAKEREWLERYISDPDIRLTLVGKTVLLEGEVDSELSRRRAMAIARALDLDVVDLLEIKVEEPEERDTPEPREAADTDTGTDTEKPPDPSRVIPDLIVVLGEESLEVFELNGFIVIEGHVPNEFRKIRAERIAATFEYPLLTLIEIEESPKERVERIQASERSSQGAERGDSRSGVESEREPSESIGGVKGDGLDRQGVTADGLPSSITAGSIGDIFEGAKEPESDFAGEIERAIGLPTVTVQMIQGAAVLDGVVESDIESQGAEVIASLFADKVVNRLQVILPVGAPAPSLNQIVSELLALPGVQVSLVGEKLLLEGVVRDQKELERALKIAGAFGKEVVNLVRVEAPLQVLLKVKVVEASRVDMERVGVSWGSLERGVLIPDVTNIGELMIGDPLERLLPIGARLEALIDEGKARLLAAPSLLTLSGEEAEFLSGGEIPVTVPKDGEMQIVWKVYGVKLNMLPVVVDEGAIEVKVRPEVSTLDWPNGIRVDALTLPAMKTRRTETTVYIQDGTTFVIGGLLENTESRQVHKLPLLGDLPIIGKLFRSEQFKTDQTELVFFVTPHILRGNEPAMHQELWKDEAMRREGSTFVSEVTTTDCR